MWIWYHSGPPQKIASVTRHRRQYLPGAGRSALPRAQEVWLAGSRKSGMRRTSTGEQSPRYTATFSSMPGAPFERRISAHEYSGAERDKPDRCYQRAIGSTANASSGSVATTVAGLIFGAAVFAVAGTAGSGFTQRSTLNGNVTEDAGVMTPGSAEATFTATDGNGVPLRRIGSLKWLPLSSPGVNAADLHPTSQTVRTANA